MRSQFILSFMPKSPEIIKTLGSLRSEDDGGRENVAEEMNSRSFNLYRNYSRSLTLSNIGELS